LAGFGFMVAVPIRIGYGVTSGEDVEDSGACDRKDYPPVFQAAALQTLAVVNELRKRRDIAKDRGVVLGQSFGGTTAIAVAAIDPPGIQGAINFAGGGGGGPKSHPQRPCGEPKLHRLFAGYGETSRMPTLWLYSENDQYFGPKFPPEWFQGFKASGGHGEFIMFPAVGANGHLLFSRGTDMWQPRVQEFLRSLGFSPLARAGRRVQQADR
jgi:dienelactone hydrolase